MASWYGPGFHGRKTANGERFDMYELTAAHKTLPLGSRVMVRNPANGKEVVVRINDRGPYAPGRILDLSQAAASQLGLIARGHGEVVLQALGDGGDGRDAGTGLNARQLAMAEPDPDASPSAKRQAQVLAQTRFGDSKLTLGNPVAAEPAGPSLPLSVAVGPPEGLSSTGVIAVIDAPRMGLNWSPWMRPDWGMQLHLPPSGSAVGAATAQQAPTAADPTPNFLPNAQAKTDVAEAPHATQRARLPLDPARTTPEPGAIAAGDVPLSTSVAMPAAGEQ
jgi:hypothetical protein